MSTQSMVSNHKIVKEDLLDKYFMDASLSLLKKIRFDFGCINRSEIQDMMILDRVAKRYTCKEDQNLREHLITSAVESIEELK